MNIRIVLAVAAATTALAQPATVHANPFEGYDFGDPSKNIWCQLRLYADGTNVAQCDIDKHNFTGPASDAGGPCPQTEGYIFVLTRTDAPKIQCLHGSVIGVVYNVLGNGQTKTEAAITCAGEAAGISCTNTSTGHFFRLSRESYQVG